MVYDLFAFARCEQALTLIANELYTFKGGLRVLEIDQANYDLTEVGYFDVYPNSDSPSFAGSWSN